MADYNGVSSTLFSNIVGDTTSNPSTGASQFWNWAMGGAETMHGLNINVVVQRDLAHGRGNPVPTFGQHEHETTLQSV